MSERYPCAWTYDRPCPAPAVIVAEDGRGYCLEHEPLANLRSQNGLWYIVAYDERVFRAYVNRRGLPRQYCVHLTGAHQVVPLALMKIVFIDGAQEFLSVRSYLDQELKDKESIGRLQIIQERIPI